ncbi:ceramide synthase 2 [Pelobates cultripes]|uniref:Ceramide synthase 2 n=1 Tax=Pelobates cultripes TaxID=61616 RepID=A0AAD1TMV5_PELCU|nr:ceramide synthase 2 [Pelobates cultripes]
MEDKVWLRAAFNPVLEKFYTQSSKHLKQTDLENLSQASNFTVCQVERWFRRRRDQERPSLQKKFREASWRFTFYLLAFIAGMAVLVDKPWFHDLREVWKDFPKQVTVIVRQNVDSFNSLNIIFIIIIWFWSLLNFHCSRTSKPHAIVLLASCCYQAACHDNGLAGARVFPLPCSSNVCSS